jgi:hypothetical protein
MGINALPRNADMLSMMPHLHMTNHVAVMLIVLVVALTTTVTFTAMDATRVLRKGGSASTPTELDTNQRLHEAVIEIIPKDELAAAAAMSWTDEDAAALLSTCGCGFEDGFDGGLAVDLDHDGDADAAWATTTQAAWVVERAHRKVFSLRTQANYGRSVASFIVQ